MDDNNGCSKEITSILTWLQCCKFSNCKEIEVYSDEDGIRVIITFK